MQSLKKALFFSTIIILFLNAENVQKEYLGLFAFVVNVASNDVLNVRKEPNYKAEKVGEIPLDAYIGIEKCTTVNNSTWCRVYPLGQNWYEKFAPQNAGWVNAKYLKFSNRGYVLIKGKKNCAYALKCIDDKCELVDDFEKNNAIEYEKTGLHTRWVERKYLKGESNFGVTPDNVDGFCNSGMFIDDYLKGKKQYDTVENCSSILL